MRRSNSRFSLPSGIQRCTAIRAGRQISPSNISVAMGRRIKAQDDDSMDKSYPFSEKSNG